MERIQWEKYQHLINNISDKELANLIGCKITTVISKRNRLGCLKRKRAPRINWNEWEPFLGKVPDKEIAEVIGCPINAVCQKRLKKGIKIRIPYKCVDWEKWDDFMGAFSDSELSKRIGCHKSTIAKRRNSKGISAVTNYQLPWDKIDKNLMGQNKRKCLSCGKIKPITEFHIAEKGRVGRKRYCKNCINIKNKSERHCSKKYFVDIFGGRCACCGFNTYLTSFQFHHINTEQKKFEISTKINKPNEIKDVMLELDKCVLLCANCHFAYHGGDLCLTFKKSKELGWKVIKSSETLTSFQKQCPSEDTGLTKKEKSLV